MVKLLDASKMNWDNFKYMVFDIPTHKGSYAERYADLGTALIQASSLNMFLVKQIEPRENKYIEIARNEVCTGMPHMERFLHDVIEKGGEGIILRDPSAPLQPGRSAAYLKHKVPTMLA